MGALDILILVLVAAALILGWRKGLVARLGRVAGVLAGVVCTRLWAPDLAEWLSDPADSADSSLLTSVVSYVVVFIVVFLIVTLLCSGLRGLLRLARISVIDRLGGALFLLLEYMLILSLLLNLWVAVFPDSTVRNNPVVTAGEDSIGTCVLDLAPDILGSETVKDCLDKAWNGRRDKTATQ